MISFDGGEHTVQRTDGWEAPDGADPLNHWITGVAVMGNTPFSMPVITHVEGNLWQGGYVPGIDLGDRFAYVVSLYPWGRYPTNGETATVQMFDSHSVDGDAVESVALLVSTLMDSGLSVLVHCQAGLNRSALVTARALMLRGRTADEAISLLRERRSPAVLCNPVFEAWLRASETR